MKKRTIVYIIFIIVLIVLANISAYFYLYFDNIRKNTKYTTELVINEKSSITYNLEDNNNRYYNSKNLNEYDINEVNKVDVFYNYVLTFDKRITGEYSYYVRGVLLDTSLEKKNIYKSDEYKYSIDNKNVININQLANIELKKIVSENVDIAEMIDAHIKYELVFNYHAYSKELNKYISDSKTIEVDIPVTSGKTITTSPYEEKKYREFSNELDHNNNTYLFICLEFLGSIILYILCIAYLIERISPTDYMNDKVLHFYLSKYKNYIIDINFLPDLSYKNVMFVDNFDELVKYSNKYRVPIDYVEIVKHKESIFAVIYDNDAYVYKVSVKKRK
jgi:hypothetical protein